MWLAFQEAFITNQEEQKAEIADIKRLLLQVLASQKDNERRDPTSTFNFGLTLPINTVEDLQSVEESLTDPAIYTTLVSTCNYKQHTKIIYLNFCSLQKLFFCQFCTGEGTD